MILLNDGKSMNEEIAKNKMQPTMIHLGNGTRLFNTHGYDVTPNAGAEEFIALFRQGKSPQKPLIRRGNNDSLVIDQKRIEERAVPRLEITCIHEDPVKI